MFLKIAEVSMNGKSIRFDVHNSNMEKVAIVTQHPDLHCYLVSEDSRIKIIDGKDLSVTLDKYNELTKEQALEDINELLAKGQKINAVSLYRNKVEPGIMLKEALEKVNKLLNELV